jgi:hypothetical protein
MAVFGFGGKKMRVYGCGCKLRVAVAVYLERGRSPSAARPAVKQLVNYKVLANSTCCEPGRFALRSRQAVPLRPAIASFNGIIPSFRDSLFDLAARAGYNRVSFINENCRL